MTGKDVSYAQQGLKAAVKSEAVWAWESINSSTCCQSMSIMYSGACVYQAGLIPEDSKPGRAVNGTICRGVMQSGKANFLANLVLYPGVTILPPLPAAHSMLACGNALAKAVSCTSNGTARNRGFYCSCNHRRIRPCDD